MEFRRDPEHFWTAVHLKLPRFPKVNPELSTQPGVGVTIGRDATIDRLLHRGASSDVYLTVQELGMPQSRV